MMTDAGDCKKRASEFLKACRMVIEVHQLERIRNHMREDGEIDMSERLNRIIEDMEMKITMLRGSE